MASVIVLLALLTATPFTLKSAFCAVAVSVRFWALPGHARAGRSSVVSPATEIWMLLVAPMLSELKRQAIRVALPSLMMVAVTPILAWLMASRMPCRELFVLSIVTVLEPAPFEVKVGLACVATAAPVAVAATESVK